MGEVVPLEVMARLSAGWYGDRLDADFAPRSTDELQEVLSGVGLSGPFWDLT